SPPPRDRGRTAHPPHGRGRRIDTADHGRQRRHPAGHAALHPPSRYASKAEHGKVVPTWNHSTVHLNGRAQIHEDGEWLPEAVDDLVEHREARRPGPWCSFLGSAAHRGSGDGIRRLPRSWARQSAMTRICLVTELGVE